MTIQERYNKALTHVRRVAGAYKRYGADFGDMLKPVKRATEGSIRRLAELENKIRAIGEQSVRERQKDNLVKKGELAKDNLVAAIDGIPSMGGRPSTRAMVELSRTFIKMVMNELFSDLSKNRSLIGLKRFVNALEAASIGMMNIISRLVNAIYDDELNDPNSTPDQNSSKYVRMINDLIRQLGGAGSKYTVADLPW